MLVCFEHQELPFYEGRQRQGNGDQKAASGRVLQDENLS